MRRRAVGIILVFIVAALFPIKLLATTKPGHPKIDIQAVTLEAESKGVVPSGIPLMVLVEVNASEDIVGPFTVNLQLKRAKEAQKFIEGIKKLNKGLNSFKWDLTSKPEDGLYVVSVEVTCEEPELQGKRTKMFRAGEKKKGWFSDFWGHCFRI